MSGARVTAAADAPGSPDACGAGVNDVDDSGTGPPRPRTSTSPTSRTDAAPAMTHGSQEFFEGAAAASDGRAADRAPTGFPHRSQKRPFGTSGAPHSVQVFAPSGDPHSEQKRPDAARPQVGQRGMSEGSYKQQKRL